MFATHIFRKSDAFRCCILGTLREMRVFSPQLRYGRALTSAWRPHREGRICNAFDARPDCARGMRLRSRWMTGRGGFPVLGTAGAALEKGRLRRAESGWHPRRRALEASGRAQEGVVRRVRIRLAPRLAPPPKPLRLKPLLMASEAHRRASPKSQVSSLVIAPNGRLKSRVPRPSRSGPLPCPSRPRFRSPIPPSWAATPPSCSTM